MRGNGGSAVDYSPSTWVTRVWFLADASNSPARILPVWVSEWIGLFNVAS